MGLVESVVCERLKCLEYLFDRGACDPPLGGARDELLLQARKDILFLLAHRVSQGVRLRAREATERRGRGHDVLLVDEDAVRSLEERLKEGVQIRHRLLAVLAADVGRNVRHWPWPIERDHGG